MAFSNPSESNNTDFQLSSAFNVKNKVALVAGGSLGIALMAVQALAVNGAKVYVVGRTGERLERVAERYGKDAAGQIVLILADISKKDDIKRLVKEIESTEKCLCISVNNAGISNSTFADWTNTYRTNVAQIYFMTTAFLPLLEAASQHQYNYSGTVLNISLILVLRKSQSRFSYNASKAAAIHLTKLLTTEIAENGLKIGVNGVAPGVFPSEMTANKSAENRKSSLPKEKFERIRGYGERGAFCGH